MSSWLGGWLFRLRDSFQVDMELKGARLLISQGYLGDITGSTGLNFVDGIEGGANKNFVMPRAGSIVGLSYGFQVSVKTGDGDIKVQVMINNISVFEKVQNITATGWLRGEITQARGIDTFIADDRIRMFLQYDTFTGTINNIIGLTELQFDT